MSKELWELKKENVRLRMALAQSQSSVMQLEFNKAQAENAALGNEWVAPAVEPATEKTAEI